MKNNTGSRQNAGKALTIGAMSFALVACVSSPTSAGPTYNLPITAPAQKSAASRSAPDKGEGVSDRGAFNGFEVLGVEKAPEPVETPTDDGTGTITINLVDVPAVEAVQQVLGGILEVNFVIEAPLDGEISLQTSRPVTADGALRLLSSALATRGAQLVQAGDFYRIVPGGRGDAGSSSSADGRVITPRYVSAQSLKSILNSGTDPSLSVEIDPVRNLLFLRGSPAAIQEAQTLTRVFDVNWMENMSFVAVPVLTTSPSQLVTDLETLLSASADGPLSGIVRFVPLERLNSVVIITAQPEYIAQGRAWIERLDRNGGQGGQGLFVIPIQNRAATEVAQILTDTLGESGLGGQGEAGLRPGDAARFTSTDDTGAEAGAVSVGSGRANVPAARIIADDTNNSIVLMATKEQFAILEAAISKLDAMANQVFLEATIAEVTLSDSLSYGLTWFFQSGQFSAGYSDASNGAVAPQFPGFSVLFSGADGRAALSAVAGVTDVNILSAPSLMVLDNRTATLQVGDQVPIVTQSSVSSSNPDAPIVNSVSLRDTGIILKVTPRVNEGGLVMLDIDQEVSDVVETSTSGIDSPTIQQRRISTSVSVRDGQSIALGGLMRERQSNTKTKLPLLGDVPMVGELFTSRSISSTRTELLVIITPRVVRTTDASLSVTNDLVRRMKSLEATFVQREPLAPPLVTQTGVNP